MVDGRPVDGTQEAGSPEDDVRADVTPEAVNQVDDARHWEAGNLADVIPVDEIPVGANLEA